MSSLVRLVPLPVLLACFLNPIVGQEVGDLANLKVDVYDRTIFRQDVCGRYNKFANGQVALRDALSGMSLSTIIRPSLFLNYDEETGIDPQEPGIMVEIMDALAVRANFTWRKSFAVSRTSVRSYNASWAVTDFLLWSIDTFDVSVGWYDKSIERMEKGTAFVEPWYDGSMILVDQQDPPEPGKINLLNWAKPFDPEVWALIIFTVLISALGYQLIEYLSGERDERSYSQWFSDNIYLSSLNFTQNFEYAPNSVAGRIFGVSVSIWALVITATYTANLASLFVEQQRPGLVLQSIEQAILLGIPICVYGGSNHEYFLRNKYRKAEILSTKDELESFQALRRGECGLVAVAKDSWLTFEKESMYNPDCDLEWVGRTVKSIHSGFAVKADAGDLCSSLIRDVLTLHMVEFINDGDLDAAWQQHRSKTQDKFCDGSAAVSPFGGFRRHLESSAQTSEDGKQLDIPLDPNRRILKGGSKSAASANGADSESGSAQAMTVEQMIGTFLLHWLVMVGAILIAVVSFFYDKYEQQLLAKDNLVRERVAFRRHGPVVGPPTRMNTFVIRPSNRSLSQIDINPTNGNASPTSQRPLRRTASSVVRNSSSGFLNKPLGSSQGSIVVEETESLRHNQLLFALDEDNTCESDHQNQNEQPDYMQLKQEQEACTSKIEVLEERMGRIDEKLEKILLLLQQRNN